MTHRLLCTIIFLSLLLTAEHAVFGSDFKINDKQQVIFLGNSITEMGESPDGYVSLIRTLVATLYPEKTIYILNAGIGGHKSVDMNARFQRDVLQFKPDWVTVSVGINDVWHDFLNKRPELKDLKGVPVDEFTTNLSQMIQRAQSSGIKVALFTTTVIGENLQSEENKRLADYNKRITKIARKNNCLLVDLNKAFHDALSGHQSNGMKTSGVLTTDGVHLNRAGNWLMARTILSAFGVPEKRIDQSQPLIEKLIRDQYERDNVNSARYAECNHEVGPPRSNEQRIVFYGSSSVDAWNLAKDFSTMSLLNRGIGGETTRQMIRRFHQDVLRLKPEAVILFYGSCNDFWEDKRMSPEETKLNTIRMVNMAKSNHINVAIGAISPVNDYLPGKDFIASHPINAVKDLNTWLKSYCESQDMPYIDFFSAVADSNEKLSAEYTYDGMHCNEHGYAKWKPLVLEALKGLNIIIE